MNTDLTTNELNTVYDASQNQQTMIEQLTGQALPKHQLITD